jgi:RHS repeat-associated protein
MNANAQYNGTVNGTNNNQMSQTNQNTLQASGYDAAGDVTNDGVNQYLYDAEGRICAVSSPTVNGMTAMTGYLYDADGTRVAKGTIQNMSSCDPAVNHFQTTNDYILGPGGEQVTEMAMDANNSMAWLHTNVYAAGSLIATYDGGSSTETVSGVATVVNTYGLHFYFDDPLGTRRAQTDYAGVLEQTCSSLPFGDGLSCTGSITAPTEHHFTGKERDTESGNDYFLARYYSSALGRFTTPDWSAKTDPVPYAVFTDPQSLNLYAYVRNNPLTRIDADGHQEPDCGCQSLQLPQLQMPQLPTKEEIKVAVITVVAIATVAIEHLTPFSWFSKDSDVSTASAAAKGAIGSAEDTNKAAEAAISSGAATGAAAEKLAGHVSDQKAGVEATKTAVGALAGAKGKDAKEKALKEVNKQVDLLKGHTKDIAQQLNKIKKGQ